MNYNDRYKHTRIRNEEHWSGFLVVVVVMALAAVVPRSPVVVIIAILSFFGLR